MPTTSPESSHKAMAPETTGPTWYSHAWNRPLSWELILRVTPRLPRPLLVPVRHATSFLCFTLMHRERAAARRNLQRVTGTTGFANLRLSYKLFYNFSRFMVAYSEMLQPDRSEPDLFGAEETDKIIRDTLAQRNGLIILTMHLGHWDMGLRLLSRVGVPVHVVMLNEEPGSVARYAAAARSCPELKVHNTGQSPLLAVELMTALRRGEIVAIQGDRPAGESVLPTPFFGADANLPAGPIQLSMATSAPVLPVAVLLERNGAYRLCHHEPLHFERVRGPGSEAALREGMLRVARAMESFVSRNPDQWFNFYDVWRAEGGASHGED
jgi:lauroyl/myristoyl acyltransferase